MNLSSLKSLFKAAAMLMLTVSMVATCASCHSVGKAKVSSAENLPSPEALVKGRVLIDPEFSGPERTLIAQGVKMWTDPLPGLLNVEISEDPIQEWMETVFHQKLVLKQERAASGLPEPDEDEEDPWTDPHDSWNAFSPGTPIWSTDEGCTDRILIIRVTSAHPMIRRAERNSNGHLIGHTDITCHKKGIFLVVDRIKDSKMFAEVTAHELGHSFGLKHDFEHNASIMFPDNRAPSACVTRRDVDSFCTRWRCGSFKPVLKQEHYCGSL